MNHMNILLAKRQGTISALKRSSSSSSSPSSSSQPRPSTNAKPKAGFSSLTTRSPTTANTTKTTSRQAPARDDDSGLDVVADGAGIGFVPAGGKEAQDSARAAVTRDLRGKLLGKRAREQKEEAAASGKRRKGRMTGGSSDEEEGRSGIGKGREKKKKKAKKGGDGAEDE